MNRHLVMLAPFGAIALGLILGVSLARTDKPVDRLRPSSAFWKISGSLGLRPTPKKKDPAEEADLRHHRSAIDRCNAEHRIPVIGYGWRIVCVDPKFIAWQEGPITDHDPAGL